MQSYSKFHRKALEGPDISRHYVQMYIKIFLECIELFWNV